MLAYSSHSYNKDMLVTLATELLMFYFGPGKLGELLFVWFPVYVINNEM